ncbi:hypothetical protein [Pyrobaculum aerophilum]|uniref:Uncharacterized protein n=1 Tax=Pyrobaculum aerophilum TaxID=13773 RepID=A0A371QYN1_9CREN|nr:hypothetical protein [Pyrobaculum aerophilum]RFA95826.1 hypothetical protein CGL52_12160 [Pyrobaculum aerophilum]RFA96198.1 hypothetical protein CGL51_05785 [Pyrobaculum aerophilum]
MFSIRDLVLFAALTALVAAVIASLFPVREGPSEIPACSDCAFKLVGPYVIRQYDSYSAIELGNRTVAKYGWAYVGGMPLLPGENATCPTAMYLWVVAGNLYVSCDGAPPKFGRFIAGRPKLEINTLGFCEIGCVYVAATDGWGEIALPVTFEYGTQQFSKTTPFWFCINGYPAPPPDGVYYFAAYFPGNSSIPPLRAEAMITVKTTLAVSGLNYVMLQSSDPSDRRPTALKVFNLSAYWAKGQSTARIYVNRHRYFDVDNKGAMLDFLLAWEECRGCGSSGSADLYVDEVWRLWHDGRKWRLQRLNSQGGYQHEVRLNSTLIWTHNARGPRISYVEWSGTLARVQFTSRDGSMNAVFEVKFEKVCK